MYCRFLMISFLTGNFRFVPRCFLFCISGADVPTDKSEVPLPQRHFHIKKIDKEN